MKQTTPKLRLSWVCRKGPRRTPHGTVKRITSKAITFTEAQRDNHLGHIRTSKRSFKCKTKDMNSSKRNTLATVHESKEKTYYMLLAIVLLFILTHSFRLAVKVYEIVMPNANTHENFEACYIIGR